jgi:hypothetical protein
MTAVFVKKQNPKLLDFELVVQQPSTTRHMQWLTPLSKLWFSTAIQCCPWYFLFAEKSCFCVWALGLICEQRFSRDGAILRTAILVRGALQEP